MDTKHVNASSPYRVVTAELHGAADDHDRDELPAYWAIGEQLPGSPGPHAFGFGLFLQDLIELTVLDVTTPQASQS